MTIDEIPVLLIGKNNDLECCVSIEYNSFEDYSIESMFNLSNNKEINFKRIKKHQLDKIDEQIETWLEK